MDNKETTAIEILAHALLKTEEREIGSHTARDFHLTGAKVLIALKEGDLTAAGIEALLKSKIIVGKMCEHPTKKKKCPFYNSDEKKCNLMMLITRGYKRCNYND